VTQGVSMWHFNAIWIIKPNDFSTVIFFILP
jgi:hypothetical protein